MRDGGNIYLYELNRDDLVPASHNRRRADRTTWVLSNAQWVSIDIEIASHCPVRTVQDIGTTTPRKLPRLGYPHEQVGDFDECQIQKCVHIGKRPASLIPKQELPIAVKPQTRRAKPMP